MGLLKYPKINFIYKFILDGSGVIISLERRHERWLFPII